MEGQLQTWISLQIKESLWRPNPVRHSLGHPYKGSTLNPLRVQLNEITPADVRHIVMLHLLLSIPPSLQKSDGWRTDSHSAWNQTKYGVCPLFLPFPLPPSVPAAFFSRLAERPLECSLWPSHWQMLLWNVMKFEMGAAVTIILGQGLSLAWYHYLWQLESAAREEEQEWERDGEIGWQAVIPLSYMSAWRQQTSGAFMEG